VIAVALPARPNGLPAIRDLPIKFMRRPATPGFEKLVGKETDRTKHSQHEYASEDGCWIIRSTQHSGHGSTNSGRARWHVSFNGRFFPVGYQNSSAHSLEHAIDDIHRKIGDGICDGFKVLAKMRQDAEDRARKEERHRENIVRARDLLGRMHSMDPFQLADAFADHVDLDTIARAIERASEVRPC